MTRLFSSSLEQFLRVTFLDENKKQGFYYGAMERPLALVIRKMLLEKGLSICRRKYKFLSSSSSQMKRHSIWMICETESVEFESIFRRLGDFDEEKYSNKNLSRRGQCFSTTLPVCQMKEDEITLEEDLVKTSMVRGKDGKEQQKEYTFTDGIGLISY